MNPFIQLRSACYLLVLVAVCAIPFALAQRNATSQSVAGHANVSEGSVRLGNTLPAATIVVTNTNDSGPGSLRNALAIARVGDTIDATGVSGTILLTSGALQITHNVSITGPGAGNLAINGNATSDVFEMEGFFPLVFEMEGFFALSTGVTISGFTITNGVVGISSVNVGGLFSRSQTLTITNCTVSGNIGVGISNNATPASFGSFASATLTITNSTVSGNSGGGISNIAAAGTQEGADAELTVSNCTISGNLASNGGGIYNTAGGGPQGGVVTATVAISNSTLSGNSATGDGGAIYNASNSGHGVNAFAGVTLGSTILNAGASGGTITNLAGFTSLGYNLASDNGGGVLTGPGDQNNTNPLLGPLQDNGGPTFTHALLPGSPAIDAGDPTFTPPPSFDQRGCPFERVFNGRIDVGSLEVQPPRSRPCPTPRPRPTPAPRP